MRLHVRLNNGISTHRLGSWNSCCPHFQAFFACVAGLDLSMYRSEVVYVGFRASCCAPCWQSFSWLDNLVRSYGPRNLMVIGVNIDKDHDRVERFLNDTPQIFRLFMTRRANLPRPTKWRGCRAAS
jgi:hypothetical protein